MACNRDCRAILEEVRLHLPFRDNNKIFWQAYFFVVLWGFESREIIEFLEGRDWWGRGLGF